MEDKNFDYVRTILALIIFALGTFIGKTGGYTVGTTNGLNISREFLNSYAKDNPKDLKTFCEETLKLYAINANDNINNVRWLCKDALDLKD